MQSTSRILTLFLVLLPGLAGGCASDHPPSGGPAKPGITQVISSDPLPSSVNISTQTIRLTFDHYVTIRQLLKGLIISPSVGEYDIAIKGKVAEIRVEHPLKKNQTYILSINKNLKSNQGETLATPLATRYTMAFSTGKFIDNATISGKVINADFSPATNALILAFAEPDENIGKYSLLGKVPDYLVQAEASGFFSFNHISTGSYRIFAFNDRNQDERYDPETEEIGLSSRAIAATGSSDLLFRLSGMNHETLSMPASKTPHASETGSISGECFASGQYVIVYASNAKASYSVTALRDKKGILHYLFPELPPGSYTVSAYIPLSSNQPNTKQQWNPGSIDPFQPADPFGYYADKVTVRARWATEHIDIQIKNSSPNVKQNH
jgi:uncharacterized protein (DUF2141 family)